MSHKYHWFKCCHCGYVGEESELPHKTRHPCGDDKCPKCKNICHIICCFESEKKAENECNDNKECWCEECEKKYSSKIKGNKR